MTPAALPRRRRIPLWRIVALRVLLWIARGLFAASMWIADFAEAFVREG